MRDVLLIVLGGLFGWLLGKLRDEIVYGVAAIAVIFGILVVGGQI